MKRIRALLRGKIAAAAAAAMTVWAALGSTPSLAQEFVKVETQARETLPAGPFLAGAYGFIWAAVLVYLVYLARSLKRVNADIEDLRKRVGSGR